MPLRLITGLSVMTKNALVVSGGGSKGAFAVGAIEYLVRVKKIRFDIVAGTSTGAQMAPLVVTNEIARLRNLYASLETNDVILERPIAEAFAAHDALYDATPYKRFSEKQLTQARADKIFASDVQMFLTTVNYNNGRVVYFQTGPKGVNLDTQARLVHITDRDELIRAMRASGHEPVFMSPVVVQPDSDPDAYDRTGLKPADRYLDGGVRVIAPIKIAIDNGATDVYAIVLSERDRQRNENSYSELFKILLRTIDLFAQQNTKNDVQIAGIFNEGACFIQALKKKLAEFGLSPSKIDELFDEVEDVNPFRGTRAVNLYIIRPKEKLAGDGLKFDPIVMAKRMLLGRQRAKEVMDVATTCDDRIRRRMPLIA